MITDRHQGWRGPTTMGISVAGETAGNLSPEPAGEVIGDSDLYHSLLNSLVLPQSTIGNLCSIHSHKSTYSPFSSQTELMTLNSAVTFCSQITYSNVTNN